MEFEGRIKNVLPARTGTSQRGNEWKQLPFVFEYKEQPTDPYPDSVLLETFDTNIINGIEGCCQKDVDGKLIVNNNELILTREIYVRVGFRHKAKVYVPQDTTKPARFINELRINSIQAIHAPQQNPPIVQQQPPQQSINSQMVNYPPNNNFAPQMGQNGMVNSPFPPQTDQYGNQTNQGGQDDDLPF